MIKTADNSSNSLCLINNSNNNNNNTYFNYKESSNSYLTIIIDNLNYQVNRLTLKNIANISSYNSYGKIVPDNVTINLTKESEAKVKNIIKIYDPSIKISSIKFMTKIKELGYQNFNYLLTSVDLSINIYYNNYYLYNVKVFKDQFNPVIGPIGAMFIEKLLNKDIDVRNKNIVDLGCGCGIVGITCLILKANKVLFTDIQSMHLKSIPCNEIFKKLNKDILIKDKNKNSILNIIDINNNNTKEYDKSILCQQDLLSNTYKDNKFNKYFDIIISSTPTFSNMINKHLNSNSDGLFSTKDFYCNLAEQSYILLKDNGYLSLWSMIPDFNPDNLINFMNKFKTYYNYNSWRFIALESQSKINIFNSEEKNSKNFYVFYEIHKINKINIDKNDNDNNYLLELLDNIVNLLEDKSYFNLALRFKSYSIDNFNK